jgi:hypothetical protein
MRGLLRGSSAGALPGIAWERVMSPTSAFFQGSRLPLILAAMAGLFFMRGALHFAAVSALAVFVAYLPYAYWREWTLYYLEAAVLSAAVIFAFVPPALNYWRRDHRVRSAVERRFFSELAGVPAPAIVFVKYTARTASHVNVVRNFPDPEPRRYGWCITWAAGTTSCAAWRPAGSRSTSRKSS